MHQRRFIIILAFLLFVVSSTLYVQFYYDVIVKQRLLVELRLRFLQSDVTSASFPPVIPPSGVSRVQRTTFKQKPLSSTQALPGKENLHRNTSLINPQSLVIILPGATKAAKISFQSTKPWQKIQTSISVRKPPTLPPVLKSRLNATGPSAAEMWRDAIISNKTLPLLTLFTSWSERENLTLVRNLTLRNWAQLKPFVIPVLFTNSSTLAKDARAGGWQVMPIRRAAVGMPILKYMYLDARSSFNTTAYAFANGDLLFTESLVTTLLTVLTDSHLPLDTAPLLMIGIRTNVPNVTEREAATFDDVKRVAKARGKTFIKVAMDYFIADWRFNWDRIPNVVIARIGYDNWLVLNAIRERYVVVDATQTLLAVHQTTSAGNFEGSKHRNSSYNLDLLKFLYKKVPYSTGSVDCVPWKTKGNSTGRLYVEAVKSFAKHCTRKR